MIFNKNNFRMKKCSKTNRSISIFSMNKRAQVQFFLENAFRIGFLMVALLAFFLLVNFYISNTIDTTRLQAEVTANRIIYSDVLMEDDPKTLSYKSGIIDLSKFGPDNMENANMQSRIAYPIARHVAVKLEIINNID